MGPGARRKRPCGNVQHFRPVIRPRTPTHPERVARARRRDIVQPKLPPSTLSLGAANAGLGHPGLRTGGSRHCPRSKSWHPPMLSRGAQVFGAPREAVPHRQRASVLRPLRARAELLQNVSTGTSLNRTPIQSRIRSWVGLIPLSDFILNI